MTVKEKMTAPIASVGADVEQPLQNFKTNQSIADLPGKGNLQATNNAENTAKSANKKNPDDLETVSMMELYDTAYPPKLPIIDGLLYNGTYLFVGSPKIGKSFFMAQIGYHISKGLPLWGFSVRQGTVLYLAFVLQDDSPRYMAKEDYIRLNKYALSTNDILISVVGTLGNACIVQKEEIPAIFSCKSTVIKAKRVDPFYLLSYLNSKYGKTLLLRKERGAIQKGLNLEDLRTLKVPLFSKEFYKIVEVCIKKAFENIKLAKKNYADAENELEKIIHISSSNKKYNHTIKNFKESVGKYGRLDAEFYQPKYDQLFSELENFYTKPLGGKKGIVTIKKSIEPGSSEYLDKGIPFIRVSDMNKFGISEPRVYLSKENIYNLSELYPKKDTILFSKDGSVGIAYKMEKDDNIVTSGALLHLNVINTLEVLPDYLTLVLNSSIVQMQAERDTNGAIIQHWKPSDIEKVVIPIIDMEQQEKIAIKIKESFSLRKKSNELLDWAKRAVEIAIEQNEGVALQWLKEKGIEE